MSRRLDLRVVCFLLVMAASCGSPSPQSGETPAPSAPAPAAAPEAPAALPGESTITGRIKFEGNPPAARVIRMESDQLCMPEGPNTSEVIVVGPGNGLQNVFVYVKDGLGDRKFA